MPTAQRRAKQKLAIAKAKAEAKTASEISHQTVATQTEISEYAVRDMIEKWWRFLDSRGVDQAQCELQFIIGMNSGPSRALAKSAADLQREDVSSHGEQQYDDESMDAADYIYGEDDDYDYLFDSQCTPGDDEEGAHSGDSVEPLTVCQGYEPCSSDCDRAHLNVADTSAGTPFSGLESMD